VVDDVAKLVRGSGMSSVGSLPSLEQVERRRFELWLVSTVLIVGLTAALAILSLWSGSDVHALLSRPAVRYGASGLAVALCAYLVEKEIALRRVSRLLFDERLLTIALSNRLQEISTLLDAGRAVNSALDLEQVLDAILRGAVELLPAAAGSIMLLDTAEGAETLRVVATHGSAAPLGAVLPVGDGIAGHVARTREPLLIQGSASPSVFPGYQPRSDAATSALCIPLIERGELLGVLNVTAPEGREFSEYDLRAVSLFAEHAAAAIAKAHLYEAHRQQAAELAYQASHDPLTDLPNRTLLEQRVRGTLADGAPLALLFVDLDGFKDVNDTYGHQVGDRLLQAVAGRVRAAVSRDDLPARLGGDEFAIALHGVTDPEVATAVSRRLLAALDTPFTVDDLPLHISASIGVAVAGLHGSDFTVLLRSADRALYAAKDAGKNCSSLWDAQRRTPLISRAAGAAPHVPQPRAAAGTSTLQAAGGRT
jgi:diguanylate cyclase (GGDEF)-like protein